MGNAQGILEQTKKTHKADIAKQFGKRYGAGYGTGAIGAVDSMFLEGPGAPGEYGRGKPKKREINMIDYEQAFACNTGQYKNNDYIQQSGYNPHTRNKKYDKGMSNYSCNTWNKF